MFRRVALALPVPLVALERKDRVARTVTMVSPEILVIPDAMARKDHLVHPAQL